MIKFFSFFLYQFYYDNVEKINALRGIIRISLDIRIKRK